MAEDFSARYIGSDGLGTAGAAALLVDPENGDEIAGGLERLTSDENLQRELARQGLERSAQFSWGLAVEKTWSVYSELLG